MLKTISRQLIRLQPILNTRPSTSLTHRLHTLCNHQIAYQNNQIWSNIVVSSCRTTTTDQSFQDAGQMRTPPPLTRSDVERRVLRICNQYDKIQESNKNKITLSTHLIQDLGLDSLDHIEIIVTLENDFGFEILESEYEKLYTIKGMVDYLVTKMNIVESLK